MLPQPLEAYFTARDGQAPARRALRNANIRTVSATVPSASSASGFGGREEARCEEAVAGKLSRHATFLEVSSADWSRGMMIMKFHLLAFSPHR